MSAIGTAHFDASPFFSWHPEPMAYLDHVVIAVPDLEAAKQAWADHGLPTSTGGRHPGGTYNALVRSAEAAYVELIAAEPDATSPWADRVRGTNGPMAWALGVSDIDAAHQALREAGHFVGDILDGSRTTPEGNQLQWRTCDLGPYPMHPHWPFLIQWVVGMPPGPADGPTLRGVTIEVPEPDRVQAALDTLGIDGGVSITVISGSAGPAKLSFATDPADEFTVSGTRIARTGSQPPA